MAATATTTARLSGAAAVAVTTAMAFLTPSGPWQPPSVILAGVAVTGVAITVLSGNPSGLAAAVVAWLARAGIHGHAEMGLVALVGSAAALVAVIELVELSTVSRRRPVNPGGDLARGAALVVIGAVGTSVAATITEVGQPIPHLYGLTAAVLAAALLLDWARPQRD